ncbi:nickel-dependent lactate racemase, partial [Candidatus Bathyarchaeota archaeon]
MVDVWLPYGKSNLCVRIPARNLLGSVEPKEMEEVSDPSAEIRRALKEPFGSKPLNELAKKGQKVAIVVDDHTRDAPSELMILPVLEELNSVGITDNDITIIFGCGTHRAVKPEEEKNLLGEVGNRIKTVSHSCKAEDLVYIGKTKSHGTKVKVNRIFAEADLKILLGDVGFHYYAGYGGGRKSVMPAISCAETIQHNHAMLLNSKARTGILLGNPVHEDMTEGAKLAGVDFILNIVMNSKGEIVRAFAGDLEEAFNQAVKLVDDLYRIVLNRKADIVVVSAGGHPGDIDLYQAYKALDNALEAVKRNGVIILVAECPEGHGNQVFYEWMMHFGDLKKVEREVKRHFIMGGHKAY